MTDTHRAFIANPDACEDLKQAIASRKDRTKTSPHSNWFLPRVTSYVNSGATVEELVTYKGGMDACLCFSYDDGGDPILAMRLSEEEWSVLRGKIDQCFADMQWIRDDLDSAKDEGEITYNPPPAKPDSDDEKPEDSS